MLFVGVAYIQYLAVEKCPKISDSLHIDKRGSCQTSILLWTKIETKVVFKKSSLLYF